MTLVDRWNEMEAGMREAGLTVTMFHRVLYFAGAAGFAAAFHEAKTEAELQAVADEVNAEAEKFVGFIKAHETEGTNPSCQAGDTY